MSGEEIKQECEKQYAAIESARLALLNLRDRCAHHKTFEGDYSWREGCIDKAEICEYCGKLIRLFNWPTPPFSIENNGQQS